MLLLVSIIACRWCNSLHPDTLFPSFASILILSSFFFLSSFFSSCFVIFKTRESQGAFNLNFARLSFPSFLSVVFTFFDRFWCSISCLSLLMILGCFLILSWLPLFPWYSRLNSLHAWLCIKLSLSLLLLPSLLLMHVTYILRFLVKDFHCITCSRDVLCFTCLSGFVFWTKKQRKEWRMASFNCSLYCISIPFAFLSPLDSKRRTKENTQEVISWFTFHYVSDAVFWCKSLMWKEQSEDNIHVNQEFNSLESLNSSNFQGKWHPAGIIFTKHSN